MDKTIFEKFKSRKFLLALISAIGGVAISLSQLGGKTAVICAIISAIIPTVTYIVTEGKIDKAAVDLTVDTITQIAAIIDEENKKPKIGFDGGEANKNDNTGVS